MGFFRHLFGFPPAKATRSSSANSQHSPTTSPQSRGPAPSQARARRDVLRLSLRSTLDRHGIPTAWIGADTLLATTPGQQPGMHLRLLIKHWDPRLLTHAVALQNSLIVRLLALDPLAANWLMGISWQFALPDESMCPGMPHPGSWTTDADARLSGPAAAGPPQDVKADLDRLFAVRDADHRENARRSGAGATEPTQPLFLKTQPMDLPDLPPDPPGGRR